MWRPNSSVISVLLAGGCFLAALTGCQSVDPSSEDCSLVPEDLNHELICAADVYITPVSIYGAQPNLEAWASALNKFGNYVQGNLWVTDCLELEAPLDDEGNVVGTLRVTTEKDGPAHIVIAFAPNWPDVEVGQFDRYMDDRQMIRYHCTNVERGANILFSSQTLWEIVLMHEICHSLGVPKKGAPNWKNGHCTRRECVMYPFINPRNIIRLLAHGYPMDLCSECAGQIEAAMNDCCK